MVLKEKSSEIDYLAIIPKIPKIETIIQSQKLLVELKLQFIIIGQSYCLIHPGKCGILISRMSC